jgi:beta-glucosidase
MIQAAYTFPSSFLWGTATAGHQVEGGDELSDWYTWEQMPGRILSGHVSGGACEWWDGRWVEDFDRAARAHQNAHRLSVEWSRIEPSLAVWDDSAIDQYRTMIDGARKRGLEPMVTLNHFTLPQWLAERGSWTCEESVLWFERYVRKVVSELKDLVKIWITINEPNVLIYGGYVSNEFPPGLKDIRSVAPVLRNLLRAHSAAYHAIHELDAQAQVGIAHHYRGFMPRNPASIGDRWLVRFKNRNFNELFPQALINGHPHFLIWQDDIPQARGTQDFFGLNYYTTEEVAMDWRNPLNSLKPGGYSQDADLSPSGFLANSPQGFWQALKWAHQYQLPIYVTENGTEDPDDGFRRNYLAQHLHKLWKAVNFNWRIKGYFHWTLVDNFEWERGWTQQWGLWELDEQTQTRKKRPSADFFSEICRTNQLSSEMVLRYAEQVFDDLFPPRGASELLT